MYAPVHERRPGELRDHPGAAEAQLRVPRLPQVLHPAAVRHDEAGLRHVARVHNPPRRQRPAHHHEGNLDQNIQRADRRLQSDA